MSDAIPPPPQPPARSRTKWIALGALAVAAAAFALITAGGIGENLVYYWGPSDLHKAGRKAMGATIRLGGMVAEGSVKQAGGASGVEFDVSDGEAKVHVKSSGVPPQMFREGIGVVVEGTMTRAGYFEGKRLMVSHGNAYKAPGAGGKPDARELMRSTEGLEAEAPRSQP